MSDNINENMTEKEAKKAEELKKKELERAKYQEQLNDPNLTKKEKKKIKRKLEELEPFDLKKEVFSWIRIFIAAVVIAFLVNNFVIINANVIFDRFRCNNPFNTSPTTSSSWHYPLCQCSFRQLHLYI